MCGIIGLFHMKNSEDVTFSEKDKAFLMKYLLTELTMETQSRGKDATGYCALFQNEESIGLKHGIQASEFCTKNWDKKEFNFANHLKLIEAYHNEVSPIASVLAHCRAKTTGTETDNNNNHPIYIENLIGIHNGCLSNHTKIFSNIKEDIVRVGEVDSEMIFQLIWLELKKGELKFCDNVIKGVTEKLDGSFAVICINKKDPNSVLFFRDTRPIELIYIKEAGFLVAVSEKRFFASVSKNYDWLKFYGAGLPDFTYESYTLPDDKAFILELDTKIAKNDSIESIINPIISIEKTDKDWKTYPYAGYNKPPYHGAYEDDYKYPNTMHNRCHPPAIIQGVATKQEDKTKKEVKNPTQTGAVVTKIEPNNTNVNKSIKTAEWNEDIMMFSTVIENFDSVYIEFQKIITDKYTIYKNNKILANKLDIPVETLTSYTLPQIANRVSKIVYDEYVENKIKRIDALEKDIEKFEKKSDKARGHILTLRGIINLLTKILMEIKSIEYSKFEFNELEKRVLSKTWQFLYANRKIALENTTLGKFIGGKNEQTTRKTD